MIMRKTSRNHEVPNQMGHATKRHSITDIGMQCWRNVRFNGNEIFHTVKILRINHIVVIYATMGACVERHCLTLYMQTAFENIVCNTTVIFFNKNVFQDESRCT